ncbi:hypothetical protein DYU11_21985 [Fibrisoma montanum]|uniref:Uncharacterized protein n=2 Tax=Fibrisoma montanum TaxID=2305895 RepID=A0A418M4V3_9BACT|nr:hypothetical protein DYU11_21985 [Fibrisoma montanum]
MTAAERYEGSWDCQVSITETNIKNPRSFRKISQVDISAIDDNRVLIAFPDSSGLRMEAEIRMGSNLVISRQKVYLYATNRYNGEVNVIGQGSNMNNQLSISYTAVDANNETGYSQSAQMSGTKR